MVEDGIHIGREDALIGIVHLNGRIRPPQERLGQIGGVSVDPVYGRGGREQVSHRQNFEFDA